MFRKEEMKVPKFIDAIPVYIDCLSQNNTPYIHTKTFSVNLINYGVSLPCTRVTTPNPQARMELRELSYLGFYRFLKKEWALVIFVFIYGMILT